MNEGRGLRWSQLAAIALVIGLLSWLGWRLYLNAGHLLGPASWISAVMLVAMAVLVIGAGLPVRRFLREAHGLGKHAKCLFLRLGGVHVDSEAGDCDEGHLTHFTGQWPFDVHFLS